MARLSEIAKAIEDDMMANDCEMSEVIVVSMQLTMIVESESDWFDPRLYQARSKETDVFQ